MKTSSVGAPLGTDTILQSKIKTLKPDRSLLDILAALRYGAPRPLHWLQLCILCLKFMHKDLIKIWYLLRKCILVFLCTRLGILLRLYEGLYTEQVLNASIL